MEIVVKKKVNIREILKSENWKRTNWEGATLHMQVRQYAMTSIFNIEDGWVSQDLETQDLFRKWEDKNRFGSTWNVFWREIFFVDYFPGYLKKWAIHISVANLKWF